MSADVYPELGDSLLVCDWLTKRMRALSLGGSGYTDVIENEVVASSCQLDIVQDPSGAVY